MKHPHGDGLPIVMEDCWEIEPLRNNQQIAKVSSGIY